MPRIQVRKRIVMALGHAVGLATVGSRAAVGAAGVRIITMMDHQCCIHPWMRADVIVR